MNRDETARVDVPVWKPLVVAMASFVFVIVISSIVESGIHSPEAGAELAFVARIFSATILGIFVIPLPIFGVAWVTKFQSESSRKAITVALVLGTVSGLLTALLPSSGLPQSQGLLELASVHIVTFFLGVLLSRSKATSVP